MQKYKDAAEEECGPEGGWSPTLSGRVDGDGGSLEDLRDMDTRIESMWRATKTPWGMSGDWEGELEDNVDANPRAGENPVVYRKLEDNDGGNRAGWAKIAQFRVLHLSR